MPLPAVFRLILLSSLWGASFLFMRIATPAIGVFPTAFFRVFFGALGLIAVLLAWRVRWRFDGKFVTTLIIGMINSGLPFALFCIAARFIPAGYSALLNASMPLMGVLIGAACFSERLTRERLGGVVVGMMGVAVLVVSGPVALSSGLVIGALACLGAAACYGVSGFLVGRWIAQRGGLDSRLIALGSQLGATLLLAPLMLTEVALHPTKGHWQDAHVWLALLVLGLACTSLAYLLYFRLIEELGPVKPLTVTLLVPLFGVLWGALFLDEQVTWAHAAGGALIALALWLILFKRSDGPVENSGQQAVAKPAQTAAAASQVEATSARSDRCT
ncbi:DMT family transporter [Salinicola endophyticus]|uniref:DMT family transporter n=1 Tax=Salinicola endophyticus TaxID=1949083 RepID=UPI000DA2041D|nr:DMT family transporter [Salinicola endophyticus]